jgi:pimeloyl-ACP methyl ester carboxylesterase
VDGFRLAYERNGDGPAMVMLHGWPSDHTDYRDIVPLISSSADVVVPDLRGFGESDKHRSDPAGSYSADAQARNVVGLIEQLGLDRPVIGGYDIGSSIAQTVARSRPELIRALVVSPPLPGIGNRILTAQARQEFWYQSFHRLDLAEQLIDGRPHAVRAYLRHTWCHWSGPGYELTDDRLDHLVSVYAEPGAFTASIGWYRAGAGAVASSLAEHPPQPRRQDRSADDGALAGTRSAVPKGLVRPHRRLLRTRPPAIPRRRPGTSPRWNARTTSPRHSPRRRTSHLRNVRRRRTPTAAIATAKIHNPSVKCRHQRNHNARICRRWVRDPAETWVPRSACPGGVGRT